MNRFTLVTVLMIVMLAVVVGCTTDMAVRNDNNPDTKRVLANPADTESLFAGAYLTYWGGRMYWYPAVGLSVLGDCVTMSWGNAGAKELGWEPRLTYDNSSGWNYRNFSRDPWRQSYKALSDVNDGLRAMDEGLVLEEADRARAFGKFIQGTAHGWLGLFFDKGFIFDETIPLTEYEPVFVDYKALLTAADGFFDDCIAICNSSTFTLPLTWINGLTVDQDYLKQICYFEKARLLAYGPRNTTDRAAVNWTQVMSLLDNGLAEEFAPEGDDAVWWNDMIWNSNRGGWTKVDNKLLGPYDTSGNYTAWLAEPVSNRFNFDCTSLDRRVVDADYDGTGDIDPTANGLYMNYDEGQFFRAARGTHHFTNYVWRKHAYHYPQQIGPMPYITVNEGDMLRAEALMRTGGSKAEVATLINKTRVDIGGMSALDGTESDAVLWKALFYEKRMENTGSAAGIAWMDVRGCYDILDPWFDVASGTIAHFPVPGVELEVLIEDIYTFGGGSDATDLPSVKGKLINFGQLDKYRETRH